MKRKILLIDDHPVSRLGIAALLNAQADVEVSAQAGDAREAIAALDANRVDLVITDLALPGMDGLELTRKIRARPNPPAVLILSMHDETLYAERALRAGASGYLMKEAATETIVEAIHRVLEGRVFLSHGMVDRVFERLGGDRGDASQLGQLTDRELQVLRFIGRGHTTRAIANQLFLSVKTVEAHRTNIMKKLGLRNATELVRYAASIDETT